MRIDDAVTYEIAPGHAVKYVGETPDGSKVYFTSEEHLTGEDPDHGGASLYMWAQKRPKKKNRTAHPDLQGRNRRQPGEPGNTANCHASWTAECGVVPFVNNSYSEQGDGGIRRRQRAIG